MNTKVAMLDPVVPVLVQFFQQNLPRLQRVYQWQIPVLAGFSVQKQRGYDANVQLKQHLAQRWELASREQQLELAKFVVAKWGGVRGNKPETLAAYVDELQKAQPATPLKGIASYSKIFSIAKPTQYAIYDARVAACLNAIQWLAGAQGVAFHYVTGRNNVVGNSLKKIGFTHNPTFALKALYAKGWTEIRKDDCYATYLQLLQRCAAELDGAPIYQLEMLLFALAEEQCQAAIDQAERAAS